MKAPAPLRALARRLRGLAGAPAIRPAELRAAASREPVLVLALGAIDARLPGEQRRATLQSLTEAVAGVPRERLIVAHCA